MGKTPSISMTTTFYTITVPVSLLLKCILWINNMLDSSCFTCFVLKLCFRDDNHFTEDTTDSEDDICEHEVFHFALSVWLDNQEE